MTKVINTINDDILSENICFIPTMGAIHEGHLSLVDIGKETNLKTLVSIFLNRRQFNNDDDFKNYPIELEQDIQFLESRGVDYIFLPQESYIYPSEGVSSIVPSKVGSILEGASRPGHFEGVLTVVNRLFDLVKPSHAVFGKKDAQQLFLIKDMVNQLDLNIEIIEGEIFRDINGLALSSRNKHLSKDAKLNAANIFKSLQKVAKEINLGKSFEESVELGINSISQNEIDLDYLEIVDEENFNYPNKYSKKLKLLTAAYVENVRLIDNIDIEI
jgi:pantoate--beta-alanine ligase